MAKLLLISNKDNNFYNFRSEKILKFKKLGNEIVLLCPYGKKSIILQREVVDL